jgi:hypothetical protein
MNMNRVGNTSRADTGEGLWIERLQQRSSSAPTKSARIDRAAERQDEGMWIERLQQSRFFPGHKDRE